MSQSEPLSRNGRAWMVLLGIIVGLIVIVAAVIVWDYYNTKGDVPRGTSVGGVSIGGMTPDEARETLERELGGIETEPVTITAGSRSSELIPAESGLSIDWEATVDRAGSESANPLERLRGLFSTVEVPVVSHVDEEALNPQLDRVKDELSTDPVDGSLFLAEGKVEQNKPKPGKTVDRDELFERVSSDWLDPKGVRVSPVEVQPVINQDVLDAVASGSAAAAVSGPIIARGKDGVEGRIPVDRMHEVVTFENFEGRIEPRLNLDAARGILAEGLAQTEIKSRNAKVLPGGGVKPHVDGIMIDWEATLTGFEGRVFSKDQREFDAVYKEEPAEFTTTDAKNATFDEVVGEFSTSGFSDASGKNISVIAAAVDGAIVNPGETFSVNGYTSPRGAAQGYVPSGIILNGRAATGVGGGVSQFATTLYNAAYFGGMEDITHTPHSYYISRYPAGREATIFDGAIDLAFKNTSHYPVRIDTFMGSDSITVRLMGVKTVSVQSINGGRWNSTEPKEMRISDRKCVPSSGAPGFTTSDTRIVSDLNGAEISRQTQTTVYDPQPIVKCI